MPALSLAALLDLGDAIDVADIAVILVVGHVEGRQVARCRDVAMRGVVGAPCIATA
jgi:hypothetical protein